MKEFGELFGYLFIILMNVWFIILIVRTIINKKIRNENAELKIKAKEALDLKEEANRERDEALNKYNAYYEKFKDIIDIQSEITQLTTFKQEQDKACELLKKEIEDLRNNRNFYEDAIKVFLEEYDIVEFGLYKANYNFRDSTKYRAALDKIRERQKEMLKNGKAAISKINWSVKGSEKAGEKMTNSYIKLMLQAFNGESDSLVVKVKYDNILKFEDRLTKERDIINRLATTQGCEITTEYLNLKIEELRLVHEYQTKLEEEKEAQRQAKEQMREEEKARREMEKALKEAHDEELRYEKALIEAKREMEKATDEEKNALNDKIALLMEQLAQAQQKERTMSQAQLTKCGHVYIISNIGSFGEDVYKIGMTRRLEPLDRVKELGDASVPFEFDVHAMIYSEDAPSLENKLHQHCNEKRVNKINCKKEFFRINIDEIESVLLKEKIEFKLTKFAVAKEYRETLNLNN